MNQFISTLTGMTTELMINFDCGKVLLPYQDLCGESFDM